MAYIYTPAIRALVVATLVAATMALLHVVVQTARAAGPLALGECTAFGNTHAPRPLKAGCAAPAIDSANVCAGDAWSRALRLHDGCDVRG